MRLRTRSGFVRKRSSSGRSSTPRRRVQRASLPATIISAPSLVGKTSYGAISGNAEPWRPGASPVAAYAAMCDDIA